MEQASEEYRALVAKRPYLQLHELTAAGVNAAPEQCGLAGSPTKVKTIQNVVFKAKEALRIDASEAGINELVASLIAERIIG